MIIAEPRDAIEDTIREHEPRVDGVSVTAELGQSVGEVRVRVSYTIKGEADTRTLTYGFFDGAPVTSLG